MDLYILDTNFTAVSLMDYYKSLIWVERYWEYGDFELYTPVNTDIISTIKKNYYILRPNTDRGMIVEDIRIESDVEYGNFITISGRSFESILDRRVVWKQTTINGSLQDGIEKLLNENVISPSKEERKIPNFIFEKSTDEAITSLKLKAQYTGDNLYEVIKNICEEKGIGFKVTLNSQNQFVFKLYSGTDRTYDQMKVPYVLFSPNFDNIINSNYYESIASYKNVALVGGEGQGTSRRYLAIGNTTGLERRELFVDARDISSTVYDDETDEYGVETADAIFGGDDDDYEVNEKQLSTEEYNELLSQRGKEYLAENTEVTTFEGQVETTLMYKYGEDFFNGDIVQIANEYGHDTKVRILEIVTSEDEEGYFVYPTFKTLTKEGA